MTRKLPLIVFSLCFYQTILTQNIPDRVLNSPYPYSQIPDTLFVVDYFQFSPSELFTIDILQGLLAKNKPMIYKERGSGYTLWLDDFIKNYGVVADSSYLNDFKGLLLHFKDKIDGYILCNSQDNSSNAAISLSSIFNAIAVTPENVSVMEELGIPKIEDVSDKDENWVLTNYDSLLSRKIVVYQKEEKDYFLAEYSVFSEALHFFDHIDSNLTTNVFNRMEKNSALLGWGDDEFQTIKKVSKNSIVVHPADWANNLSTLSNFNAEVNQLTHTQTINNEDNVHTVCFVMSDGDNIQWTLSDFAISESWYGSSKRGTINLGWTISPAMAELSPTVLNYFYQEAANQDSAKDYFIAGPSGLGYMFPEEYPAIDSAAALLNRFMGKADLNIVNIIGNDRSDEYLEPYLEQENIDALFYYNYSNYSGASGSIKWINGKPIIGGKRNLWDGFETPQSLAMRLNFYSTDSYSPKGYSLIPVHAWSMDVEDVIKCVSLLDSNVIVVTPDEFVKRIQSKLAPVTNVKSSEHKP